MVVVETGSLLCKREMEVLVSRFLALEPGDLSKHCDSGHMKLKVCNVDISAAGSDLTSISSTTDLCSHSAPYELIDLKVIYTAVTVYNVFCRYASLADQ